MDGTDRDFVIYEEGCTLSSDEARVLEAKVNESDSDCDSRLKLLGYYAQEKDQDSLERWIAHRVWFINNRPSDWVSGNLPYPRNHSREVVDQLRSAWLDKVKDNLNDASICGRCGEFFSDFEEIVAMRMLRRAIFIEANQWQWQLDLARLYIAMSANDAEQYMALAIAQGRTTLTVLEHRGERFGLANELTHVALEAGKLSDAEFFAEEMKIAAIDSGLKDRKFMAHCQLGRIALAKGDIDGANEQLMLAGECGYFSDLRFANELFAKEQSEAVLAFLEKCLSTAGEDTPKVASWIDELKAGKSVTIS